MATLAATAGDGDLAVEEEASEPIVVIIGKVIVLASWGDGGAVQPQAAPWRVSRRPLPAARSRCVRGAEARGRRLDLRRASTGMQHGGRGYRD